MPLPTLTHLQFLVVRELLDGELAGREVRERLAEHHIKKTGPAFYQMMARLEDGKFVEGFYVDKEIDGQKFRERKYRLTGHGSTAFNQSCEFYAPKNFGLAGG